MSCPLPCSPRTEPSPGVLPRRDFVRVLAFGTFAAWTASRGWTGVASAAVTPSAVGPQAVTPGTSVLRLKRADFPALNAAFGSVRLGFATLNLVSPVGPLLVNKDGDQFYALSAECTHEGVVIPAVSTTTKISVCPRHGSRFAPDGRVLFGPARAPLPSYTITADSGGFLSIEIPGFPAAEVTIGRMDGAAAQRVRLSFLGVRNLDYEVLAQGGLGGEWKAVPFSRTETGAATETVFRGTGSGVTLFVDRTEAVSILAVGVKVRTV